MYKKIVAIALCSVGLSSVALASDPIAAGSVANLTNRGDYVLFEVVSGQTNSCANCPPDPAGLGPGGYCWVATSQTLEVQMILTAMAHGLLFSGRVYSLATDCTVYQITL